MQVASASVGHDVLTIVEQGPRISRNNRNQAIGARAKTGCTYQVTPSRELRFLIDYGQ